MASSTLHASATETTSGTGSPVSLSSNVFVGMFVNVTAASGTLPSLIVKLQESPNGSDWYDVPSGTTGSLSTAGLTNVAPSGVQEIADTVRCVWTVGGVLSPSFTFEAEIVTGT